MLRAILYLMFLVVLSSACQEEVRLPLDNTLKTPVIEATWTNNTSANQVKLSYSREYYDTLENEIISDATVRIYDETSGEQIDFRYLENNDQYLPINNKTAILGHNYKLEVMINDMVYTADGHMLEPPILDSITYNFENERPPFRSEGYYLTIYGKIPFEENNYYRLKVSKNDTLLNRRSDYLLFDDTFGTSILNNGFELNTYTFKAEDKVKLELYRMNEGPYDYLNQLIGLLFNDGGLFSPPPENPKSNIVVERGTGQVLGYFMTAPVVVKTVVIEED